MYYGITDTKDKIHARNARRGSAYYCPICNNQLILRNGVIKTAHFAHGKNTQCTDDWIYDASAFRCNWLNIFEDSKREVILVDSHGKKHIADILEEDYVLEFQESRIKMTEFEERNQFFMSCGYNVVWLFHLSEAFENDEIIVNVKDGTGIWKNPFPAIKALKKTQTKEDRKLVIFAQIGEQFNGDRIVPIIIKFQDVSFVGKELHFSFGKYLDTNEFLDSYSLSDKIMVSVEKEINSEIAVPEKSIQMKEHSILYLWKMNYRVAIFYNQKHDTYAKIFDDQAEVALKSKERKWMGFIRSGKFKTFSKKTMEVYGADRDEWVVKWFVTHQDAVY